MEVFSYTPQQINQLPDQPGVYRFINQDDKLIYVGKAKNLKKRASSYFTKQSGVNRKTRKMVGEIVRLEVTVVNSEFDALLLENSLIKTNQPKYNILLRDDKSYPYICVSNERFPRVFATRNPEYKQGKYFGPYASVKGMNNVLALIRKLYTIRTCSYNLSEENIEAGKFKVCLEYHIGNCRGPCEKLQSEEEYNKDIALATNILKGHLAPARQYFKTQMQQAVEELAYERAQDFKEKLELLSKFQSRSQVVNQQMADTDVITIVSDEKNAFVNYLKVNEGAIVLSKTVEIKKKLEESDEEILLLMLLEMRQRHISDSGTVLTNVPFESAEESVEIVVPKIGDKKKLVDLSQKNANLYRVQKLNRSQSAKQRENRVLKQLQEDLQMKNLPMHIECFDNSNMQGTNPVASMVCFMNGKPAKKEYRKFNIKTVIGPDDFASMKEVVGRRYRRLKEEEKPLPDLIVIDGGKGQLSASVEALRELGLYGDMVVIGIAKRLEEIYYPGDQFPLHISKKSESLKLIQRIRDEAHRFAITFHRQKRSNQAFQSSLEQINGIGKATAQKLIKHFGSVKRIKASSDEELRNIVGDKKAKIIREGFAALEKEKQ